MVLTSVRSLPLPRRLGVTVLALTLGATATSCGSDDTPAARGDCPTTPVPVVVSVDQWGDIVRELGGDCVDVTVVITGSSGDPHDYEPTPADLAAFGDARLVVVNGLDYDHWAVDAVEALDEAPALVDAGEVAGRSDGDNPHVWYSPEVVRSVATAVDDELRTLLDDAGDYLDGRRATWTAELDRYDAAVATTAEVADGRSFAATESVFDDMAAALGMVDVTPEGYQRAAANESDPAPADLAAFDTALSDGSVDVLIFNTQTEGSGPERLRETAEASDVAVVEVTETVPDGADSFVAWQTDQLTALRTALAG